MVALIHTLGPIISPKKHSRVTPSFPSPIRNVMRVEKIFKKLLGGLNRSPIFTFNIESRGNVNVENHDIGLYIVDGTQ